jgi:hypothetical protein
MAESNNKPKCYFPRKRPPKEESSGPDQISLKSIEKLECYPSMKKLSAFCVFLMLGATQVLAGQSVSQFSAPSARQLAAQASAAPAVTTKTHVARSKANISNPAVNPVGFVSGTQIPTNGLAQWSAVVADFNDDGKLDVAAPVQGSLSSFAISVALSNGDGTFQSGVLIPNPNGVQGDQLLFGDFHNTGKKDLVVVHGTNPATFELWVPTGDTAFTVPSNAPSTITPNFLVGGAVFDVNGDGNLDLVFVDAHTPANVWTLLGNGNGTFQAATSVALGSKVSNVVFADFNGDGIIDFAAITGTQDVVYLGQANGTFVAGTPLSNPDSVYDICNNAAGDLNGDGKPELVAANCSVSGAAGNLTIYVNNGDGTFKTGVYYSAATEATNDTAANISPLAVTIADVNGDNKNDLIVSNHDAGDVTVLLGNGDGTVNVPTVGYNAGGTPKTSPIVADFNGDGNVDIVVPDFDFSFAYLQGYGDGTFRGAQDFFSPVPQGFSAGATAIATGDFNGDGYPDLVIGNYGYNPPNGSGIGITVFLSNPDGSLQPGINLGKGGSYEGVAVADFNGDGYLDIAAVNESSNGVQIYLGNGKGTFITGNFVSTGSSNAFKLIAGDFNGDGHPDLAVVNTGSNNVSVLLNDGTANFATAAIYSTNGTGTGIAAADVNGDGILDLVVPQSNQGVDVLLGSSTGTFQTAKTSTFAFNNLGNLALGDLNGDGKLDIAVTVADHLTPNEGLAVAQGNGDGTFKTPVLFATTLQNTLLVAPTPGDVKMFDLNGDGKLDVVYSNSSYGTIGVLYNTGTNLFAAGMFYDPLETPAGSGATNYTANAIALVDINNDGAMDVVTANYNFAGATVLLNETGSSNALKSSSNPVVVGASVTFTATVAANVRGVTAVPTGSISFLDGSTTLGSANLASGVATFSSAKLAVGTHNVTAVYSGDANFHARTSLAVSEVVTATPDFALGTQNPTVTVTAGNSATYTFSITPSGGYTGVVTFSCPATLPSKVGCSFNPASLTPSSGTYPSTTLTLTTTAAVAAMALPARPNSNPAQPTFLASIAGFGIFGMVFAGAGKRNRRHMAILGLILLMAMFMLVGCGGSNSNSQNNNPGTPGTASGTYNITVTATGAGNGAPAHTMNVTLIVQ